MKKNVLSARVLTIMLATGIAFSFLQTPVGPVSAMAAEEVSAEEGPAAGEQSEAPEVSVPEEALRQEDAAPADADEPAESAERGTSKACGREGDRRGIFRWNRSACHNARQDRRRIRKEGRRRHRG